MAIHARGVVARGKLCAPRRGRRIVLAAGTVPVLVLASLGRLQQGETKSPFGGGELLSLCRHLWNPAIGRIDNHRRARAGVLPGYEQLVIGAADVELGPALRTPVFASQRRPLSIQLGPLRRGKKFLVRKSGGALLRRIGFLRPND